MKVLFAIAFGVYLLRKKKKPPVQYLGGWFPQADGLRSEMWH